MSRHRLNINLFHSRKQRQPMSTDALIFTPGYLPGYKYGGPQRSTSNIIGLLSDRLSFRVVTSDRDFGDKLPYPDLTPTLWQSVGGTKVAYVPPSIRSFALIRRAIAESRPKIVHFNSLFSPIFTLLPLLIIKLTLAKPTPMIIIAPRGELDRGALSIKPLKKSLFIRTAKLLGAFDNIVFHAASEAEHKTIRGVFPNASIKVAPPPPGSTPHDDVEIAKKPTKLPGSLRIVFLSRISRKKNLDALLKALKYVASTVHLDIYGPLEEKPYAAECQALIGSLPGNVHAKFCGPIAHQSVHLQLSQYDVFCLPSKAENYGHVYVEALRAGLPIIASDQTPWQNLAERGVGWTLAADDIEGLRSCIDRIAAMDDREMKQWQERALSYSRELTDPSPYLLANLSLFAVMPERE